MKKDRASKPSDILNQIDFKVKRYLGQNFIFDLNITNKIVKSAFPLCDTLIEIGPGPGTLTKSILTSGAKKLFVIEKDTHSIHLLNPILDVFSKQLTIINTDVLNYPIWKLGTKPRQVIANLPYNISTKILIILLKNINNFQKLNLMFQKEVALRIIAKPGEKFYGRLSVLAQLLTKPKILFDIPNTVCTPRPKVESSFVEFIPLKKPMYRFNFNNIEKITHLTFSKRRKMLRSILKKHGG